MSGVDRVVLDDLQEGFQDFAATLFGGDLRDVTDAQVKKTFLVLTIVTALGCFCLLKTAESSHAITGSVCSGNTYMNSLSEETSLKCNIKVGLAGIVVGCLLVAFVLNVLRSLDSRREEPRRND